MKLAQSPIQGAGGAIGAGFGRPVRSSRTAFIKRSRQHRSIRYWRGCSTSAQASGWRSCTPRVRHSGFRPLRPLSGGMICLGSSSLFSLAASLAPCCSCLASAVLRPHQRLCSSILKALQRWGLRGLAFRENVDRAPVAGRLGHYSRRNSLVVGGGELLT